MKGNITRRGKSSWRIKYDAGRDPETGVRDTRYVTFRGSKKEAEVELVRLLGALEKGIDVRPDKVTVSEYLDRWQSDWARLNVSPKTYERYVELLRLHVRPHIGQHRIQKLTSSHLVALYRKLRGTDDNHGLAARTVVHVHRVIHLALRHAVSWQIVVQNVAAVKDVAPKVEDEELEILTPDQVTLVLRGLKDRSIYPIVAFALASGMRRGEILALRWRDTDLTGNSDCSVRVERAVEQTKDGLRFKPPKTKRGRRTIAIPATIAAELRGIRLAQQQLCLALGLGKLPEDALVFPNPDGTTRSPNGLTKDWTRNRDALALPDVTFHAFRHTHASQLIASGMDVITVSRRLGHKNPTVTLNIYGHLFGARDSEAAAVMENAFAVARTE